MMAGDDKWAGFGVLLGRGRCLGVVGVVADCRFLDDD